MSGIICSPLPGWEGIEGRVKGIDFQARGRLLITGGFILAGFLWAALASKIALAMGRAGRLLRRI